MLFRNFTLVLSATFLVAGCSDKNVNAPLSAQASVRWAQQLDAARRVNANWTADCTTDAT